MEKYIYQKPLEALNASKRVTWWIVWNPVP